ncbi:hypothetical protein M0802_002280 [Mischocyttarus mexicanus]|nr:hypothetical protein M0802_002280 [Mischocyttarus mexicanus]
MMIIPRVVQTTRRRDTSNVHILEIIRPYKVVNNVVDMVLVLDGYGYGDGGVESLWRFARRANCKVNLISRTPMHADSRGRHFDVKRAAPGAVLL